MSNEEWRPVLGFAGYEVSDQGRVRSFVKRKTGRILRHKTMRGYWRVNLGSGVTRTISRLVCEAWHGPMPEGKDQCAHRDGDKDNNTPANLYWADAAENAADRERHGTTLRGPRKGRWCSGDDHWTRQRPQDVPRGDRHGFRLKPERVSRGEAKYNAKLSDEAVAIILATPRIHGSGRTLATRFGVSMGLISAVRNGRSWHLANPLQA